MSEYILCAAIWFKDGLKHEHQPVNINSGFVVCGRRHHNCYMTLAIIRRTDFEKVDYGENKQGFVTSSDRFVDRKEGLTIARKANQIIHDMHDESNKILVSEDLY